MAGILRPCSQCARHVRVRETACPFCGASLSAMLAESIASPDVSAQTRTRITRAAILFAGATVVAACGGKETTVDDGSSGSSSSSSSGSSGNGTPVPLYGVPPVDSGADTGSEAGSDAGRDASADAKSEGGNVPAYGIPPMDD